MKSIDFPFVIVGGGVVGMTLAFALARMGWPVALVEARAPQPVVTADTDFRSIGLNFTSQQFLCALGLWSDLQADACAMRQIHISERGRFGATRLNAEQEAVDAFGYIVPMHRITATLQQAVSKHPLITLYQPASVIAYDAHTLSLRREAQVVTLRANAVIAADGKDSALRGFLQLPSVEKDYKQCALVVNAKFSKTNPGIAYERFMPGGPIAVLPHGGGQCGVVWTLPSEVIPSVMSQDDASLSQAIQRAFGYRLGRVMALGQRAVYPLSLSYVKTVYSDGVIFMGNAAQCIHPIAAQGLNLGLRDVAAFVRLLETTATDVATPFCIATLGRAYYAARQPDRTATIKLTDNLLSVFASKLPVLSQVRSVSLSLLELYAPLRRRIARSAMGRASHRVVQEASDETTL